MRDIIDPIDDLMTLSADELSEKLNEPKYNTANLRELVRRMTAKSNAYKKAFEYQLQLKEQLEKESDTVRSEYSSFYGDDNTPEVSSHPTFEYIDVHSDRNPSGGYLFEADRLNPDLHPETRSTIAHHIVVPDAYDIVPVLNHYGTDGWEYIGTSDETLLFKRQNIERATHKMKSEES